MTRRRWIADQSFGDRAALTGGTASHLARVLRARVGQEFDVVAEGRVRRARVSSISEQRVEFDLGEDIGTTFAADISLLLAIFKFDRMEWALEKATELGARRIVPLIARRSDAHLAVSAAKRVERWRRIAREAAQQARRSDVPEVAAPEKLRALISATKGRRVVLSEAEDSITLRAALAGAASEPVALAIGPEGGWSPDELELFSTSGWTAATLGPTILRAETAAIAALAIAFAEIS
jgi:16S rRNA (uracil1498-N3)-methyltransferase